MRRLFIVPFVPAFALLTVLAGPAALRLGAQEATPVAAPNLTVGQLAPIGQPFEVIPGVELEILNEGQPAHAPGQSLVLYRLTLQPGAEVPIHIHPGTTLGTVETGSFGWTLVAGTIWVTRPGAPPEQVTAPGTELVLAPGEGVFYNDDVIHTARAAGDAPTSVLVTALFAVGQPFFTPSNELGTPVAM